MALKDFALRVSLTVTKPQLTAKDDKATADAEDANNARGAGQYRKDLYPKHLIAPINEVETGARSYVARNTIDGILPASRFMDFANTLATFEVAFNQAVTVFMNNYSSVLTAAQIAQGGLFDPSLYPDMSALRQRFSWQVRYDPIADTSSFATLLAPMEKAAVQQITSAVTKQVEQQNSALMSNAVGRLQKVVANFAEAMGRPDRAVINKKTGGVDVRPPVIREAVRDNIDDCIALLAGYVDALPPGIAGLMGKAAELTTLSLDTLRDDSKQREAHKAQADALMQEIAELMGEPPLPATMLNSENLPNPTEQPSAGEYIPPPPAPESDSGDLFADINRMYEE